MNITVRKANISDVASIVRINVESWKNSYQNIFPIDYLDKLDSSNPKLIEKYRKKIDEYIVATVDDMVVGFTRYGINQMDYSSEYGEIYALYVDIDYREKNIGKVLLEYAINDLKDKYKYCLVATLKDGRANSFYLKNGGKLIGNEYFQLQDKDYLENIYLYVLDKKVIK